MLGIKTTIKNAELITKRRDIEVYLNDDYALSVPPVAEVKKGSNLKEWNLSLSEIYHSDPFGIKEVAAYEATLLHKKNERFKDSVTYMYRIASLNSVAGQFQNAEPFLRKALEINNDNIFIKEALFKNLSKQNKLKTIGSIFSTKDLNTSPNSNLCLAYQKAFNNELDKAEEYANAVLKISNSNYEARNLLGAIDLWNGKFERAIRNYRVALSERSNSYTTYVNLAASYCNLKQYEKAIKTLKKAVAKNPFSENAVIFYVDLLNKVDKVDESISALTSFLKYDPKSSIAWDKLAYAYCTTGKYKKAKDALLRQKKLSDNNFSYNNLALIAQKEKKYKEAIEYYSKAIDRNIENNVDITIPAINLLNLLLSLKKYNEVHKLTYQWIYGVERKTFSKTLIVEIKLKYLAALDALEKYELAEAETEKFIKDDIEDSEAKLNMLVYAMYYSNALNRDRETNMKYVRMALDEINNKPDISEELKCKVYNNVMFAYLLDNRLEDAKNIILKLNKFFHKDPFSTATLGLYNLMKCRFNRGEALYKEAISLATDKVLKRRIRQRLNFEKGKFYLRNKEIESAQQFLNKAAAEKNGFSFVKERCAELLGGIKLMH